MIKSLLKSKKPRPFQRSFTGSLGVILTLAGFLFISSCVDSARVRETQDLPQTTTPPKGSGEDNSSSTKIKTRPDKAFRITSYCACKGNKNIMAGTGCKSFCQGKNASDKRDLLYLSVRIDPTVVGADSPYKDLESWCSTPVPDNPNQALPVCKLKIQSAEADQYETILPIDGKPSKNNVQIDIEQLSYNKTFRFKIIESQSMAASANMVQIRKKRHVDSPYAHLSPVGIDPVNQYSCIVNLNPPPEGANQDYQQTKITEEIFYYSPTKAPYEPLPPGTRELWCFDWQHYNVSPTQDRIEYPRLKTIAGAFKLWDKNDPRFRDNWSWKTIGDDGQNQKLDIEDLLEYEYYKITFDMSKDCKGFFKKLDKLPSPKSLLKDQGNDDPHKKINFGYYLRHLSRDKINTYCPTEEDYQKTQDFSPMDRSIGRILGVGTEPLYVAEKAQAETYTNQDGSTGQLSKQQMYITRTELDKISFYEGSDGVRMAPKQSDMDSYIIYYYWPPFTSIQTASGSRFIGTSEQKLYKVLKQEPADSTGVISRDGKIGCVPKN